MSMEMTNCEMRKNLGNNIRRERIRHNLTIEALAEACRALGGVPEGKGDVAYRIQVFPFLPVIIQFWNSDEEFEPELQFLWDTNVLQYLHFETLWYVMGHMVKRLREMVENRK